jgi:hypothetical protein
MRQNDDNLLFFQHQIEQREEKETINDGDDEAEKIDHFLSLPAVLQLFTVGLKNQH